jgi:hypothetical protein
MMGLERDCDKEMSFGTHFLVFGQIWNWSGLTLLLLFFYLVNNFFLTSKYGGSLDILMCRLVSFSHVMIQECAIIYPVRRMVTI